MAHEEGSAYLVTLLILLVLTIAGLSLAVITETEMRIGSNEKIIQRSFVGAQTGVGVGLSRVLLTNDYAPKVFTLDIPHAVGTFDQPVQLGPLQSRVETSHFLPIQDSPCNFCEINNAGGYEEGDFSRVIHAVTSMGMATVGGLGDVVPQGARTMTTILEVQPWRVPPEAFLEILENEQELERIRF